MAQKLIKRGDLVCMFRRRERGLGMVVKTEQSDEPWTHMERTEYFSSSNKNRTPYQDAYYRYEADVYERELVKVDWVVRPSEYRGEVLHKQEWLPVSWLKKIKNTS
tara:strand:+ start:731 stop:1048 length:318 start_codon:yes stop_codon:yes gene_type:complete